MFRDLLDPVQDPVAGREEVLLHADVGVHRRALAAVGQVGARRPHEVAAEAVDVVGELDVVERVGDPQLVADLGLGGLGRPGEHIARARVRRADVAVEERRERVVAVEVDAPGVARARVVGGVRRTGLRVDPRGPEVRGGLVVALLAADDAVVGEVAPLEVEVVDRVVRAVGVRRRQDEDVEVVDEPAGRRVDRVVAQQLLGRLQARQRRRPLAGVLLAVEEDADPGAVALLSDPHDGVAERPARHVAVGRRREEVGQVDPGPGRDDAAPRRCRGRSGRRAGRSPPCWR